MNKQASKERANSVHVRGEIYRVSKEKCIEACVNSNKLSKATGMGQQAKNTGGVKSRGRWVAGEATCITFPFSLSW
jgi:hypothetical protein